MLGAMRALGLSKDNYWDESPIFRAAMQIIVGVEQNHNETVMKLYADNLRKAIEPLRHPSANYGRKSNG